MSDQGIFGLRGNEGQVLGWKNGVLQAVDASSIVIPFGNTVTQPTRVLGTVYQNTTGAGIMVIVGVQVTTALITDQAVAAAFIGPTNAVATFICESGIVSDIITPGGEFFVMTFMVPAGFYYKVEAIQSGSGLVTLDQWTEVQ